MAKELPYFKFDPSEWITGDITLCSMEAQGLFINICTYYWKKDCSICLANVKQRFSKWEASLKELLEHNIILLDEDENVIINFLDEQMSEFIDIREKRAIAGAKGGKANAKQMLSKRKAKSSNKDKIREEKKREDNSVRELVDYLNKKANKNYSYKTDNTVKLLNARLVDYSIEQIKNVIDSKCSDWLDDEKMNRFLRPETLFNKTKFENYINECSGGSGKIKFYTQGDLINMQGNDNGYMLVKVPGMLRDSDYGKIDNWYIRNEDYELFKEKYK